MHGALGGKGHFVRNFEASSHGHLRHLQPVKPERQNIIYPGRRTHHITDPALGIGIASNNQFPIGSGEAQCGC